MYKSELQAERVLGSFAEAIINGRVKALIFEVIASDVTNGLPGLLVCPRAPIDEDMSETFSLSRDANGYLVQFYNLEEFIPMGEL